MAGNSFLTIAISLREMSAACRSGAGFCRKYHWAIVPRGSFQPSS